MGVANQLQVTARSGSRLSGRGPIPSSGHSQASSRATRSGVPAGTPGPRCHGPGSPTPRAVRRGCWGWRCSARACRRGQRKSGARPPSPSPRALRKDEKASARAWWCGGAGDAPRNSPRWRIGSWWTTGYQQDRNEHGRRHVRHQMLGGRPARSTRRPPTTGILRRANRRPGRARDGWTGGRRAVKMTKCATGSVPDSYDAARSRSCRAPHWLRHWASAHAGARVLAPDPRLAPPSSRRSRRAQTTPLR